MRRRCHSTMNIISRQAKLRRSVFYFFLFVIWLIIAATSYRYYHDNHLIVPVPSTSVSPMYNEFINQRGEFLNNFHYAILHHVINPLSLLFADLYSYLDQIQEIKLYYQLISIDSYHVKVTSFKHSLALDKAQINRIKDEQMLLDTNKSETICTGERVLIVDKDEIRLEVQFSQDWMEHYLKPKQKHWSEIFDGLIDKHHEKFYITLAKQYRPIEEADVLNLIKERVSEWQQWPIYVELDPVEICSFTTFISYTPLLDDALPIQ